jgi:hypothetical protein
MAFPLRNGCLSRRGTKLLLVVNLLVTCAEHVALAALAWQGTLVSHGMAWQLHPKFFQFLFPFLCNATPTSVSNPAVVGGQQGKCPHRLRRYLGLLKHPSQDGFQAACRVHYHILPQTPNALKQVKPCDPRIEFTRSVIRTFTARDYHRNCFHFHPNPPVLCFRELLR